MSSHRFRRFRHTCPFPTCQRVIPTKVFACARHWATLPERIRIALECAAGFHDGPFCCGVWGRTALMALKEWQRQIRAQRADIRAADPEA